MRASTAVSLLLVSSMSIFGIYSGTNHHSNIVAGPEPVWVNGQQGVYDPDTGEFVPIDSPRFAATCELIRQRRAATQPGYDPGYYQNGQYYHGSPPISYSSHYSSGYSGSGYSSSGDSDVSSIRGGIGGTGHSFGGGSFS
jgi:hypothetical protein